MAKCLPTMQETQVLPLGQVDPLEKEMETHSSTLAWKIPWMEEPDGLKVHGLKKGWTRLSNFTSHNQYHSDISVHFTTLSFYLLFISLYLKKA